MEQLGHEAMNGIRQGMKPAYSTERVLFLVALTRVFVVNLNRAEMTENRDRWRIVLAKPVRVLQRPVSLGDPGRAVVSVFRFLPCSLY